MVSLEFSIDILFTFNNKTGKLENNKTSSHLLIQGFCSGFLITGGSEHPTSVELFLPKSGQACLLPQILGVRKVIKQ